VGDLVLVVIRLHHIHALELDLRVVDGVLASDGAAKDRR